MAIIVGPSKGPIVVENGVAKFLPTPFVDAVSIEFTPGNPQDSVAGSYPEVQRGRPSIINPYAITVFPAFAPAYNSIVSQNRLIDGGSNGSSGNLFSPPARGEKASVPTIIQLVNDEKLQRKTPYYYTDFLYCKYVGLIPNNQLITLRRYPAPTFDNLAVPAQYNGNLKDRPKDSEGKLIPLGSKDIDSQEDFYPIAQAVTWFGEATGNKLSEILSFSVNMNWKDVEAEVNTVAGNEQGSEDSPLPGVAKFLGMLTGQVNTPFATANSQYDPYNNGPYAHRVYGPVNVISKVKKRDRGIDYKQTISLNFEYELKSIGSINPKAAMLDLMSNLLALTYNNAAFWGGANRYFPQKPTYPFLGGVNGMNAWYRADPTGFTKSVGSQISSAFKEIGNILSQLAADPISTLKQIAAGAAKLGMIELGKGRAPSIVAIRSLLTGEPVGEWHMVVGNPYAPIAQIGNLICTEAKFQFNDVIGADNFPTELKVTITIEHGRPRDAGDIQSIFNFGEGRIYYPPKGNLDELNNSSATQNSKNDTSWKTGNIPFGSRTQSVGLFTGTAEEYDRIRQGFVQNTNRAWDLADKMFLRTGGSNVTKK